MPPWVLIVQDENVRSVTYEEFAVAHERTGESGFFRAATEAFDVVVLAASLPERGGLEVLRALRAQGLTTPVLLMTAPGDVEGRLAALDAGADDVAASLIAPAELHARIRALALRGASTPATLCAGDVELDPMAHTGRRAGRPLRLTLREFQLLEYLVRHRGEVVTRDRLCHDVWDGCSHLPLENALDVHMARLRRKVDGNGPRLIHTVRGVGFAFGEEIPSDPHS